KNGLGFTAMPAFSDAYKDEDIWAMVAYVRALQRGDASTITIPAPTQAQLLLADPRGDRMARGAAVYFAQGCHLCHGPEGDAPGGQTSRSTCFASRRFPLARTERAAARADRSCRAIARRASPRGKPSGLSHRRSTAPRTAEGRRARWRSGSAGPSIGDTFRPSR